MKKGPSAPLLSRPAKICIKTGLTLTENLSRARPWAAAIIAPCSGTQRSQTGYFPLGRIRRRCPAHHGTGQGDRVRSPDLHRIPPGLAGGLRQIPLIRRGHSVRHVGSFHQRGQPGEQTFLGSLHQRVQPGAGHLFRSPGLHEYLFSWPKRSRKPRPWKKPP